MVHKWLKWNQELVKSCTRHIATILAVSKYWVTFSFFEMTLIFSFFVIVMNSREIIYLKGGIWPSTSSSLLCLLKFWNRWDLRLTLNSSMLLALNPTVVGNDMQLNASTSYQIAHLQTDNHRPGFGNSTQQCWLLNDWRNLLLLVNSLHTLWMFIWLSLVSYLDSTPPSPG